MSQLGQTATSLPKWAMSALTPDSGSDGRYRQGRATGRRSDGVLIEDVLMAGGFNSATRPRRQMKQAAN
jgi:hypothetical protein